MGANNQKSKSQTHKWRKNDLFVERNINFSNWMGDMSNYIKDTRLVDLRIIRSHQSATYCINSFLDKISICQNNSIYYQLYGGVRVLDLRPGNYDNNTEITCGHGPHKAIRISEVFQIIKDYLSDHPKEFIIIEMESAGKFCGFNYELTDMKKIELIQMINTFFGDIMVKSSDQWFDLSKITMGQIWENNKRVMIISINLYLIKMTN